MWGSPFDILLLNRAGYLPARSHHFIPRDEAYKELREMTGQDFGDDIARWQEWGRANHLSYPGFGNLTGP